MVITLAREHAGNVTVVVWQTGLGVGAIGRVGLVCTPPKRRRPAGQLELGLILKEYRRVHGLTQTHLAELLLTTQPNLSKIESGKQSVRDVEQLQWMADRLNLPHERLGLLPHRSSDGLPTESLAGALGSVGDRHRASWTVRREMNGSRHLLGPLAAPLHDGRTRLEPAGVLAPLRWLPAEPVDLADIDLAWHANPSPPTSTGAERQASRSVACQPPAFTTIELSIARHEARPRGGPRPSRAP